MPKSTSTRRAVRVLSRSGIVFAPGLQPAALTLIAHHWNAVRRYLEYGDDSALVDVERTIEDCGDVTVGDHVLLFDLDLIEYYAMRGDVRFESIYDEVV